jgi:hypothetical protein
MTKREREVCQRIMQVLGPMSICECPGCNWEVTEAIRLLQTIGIRYRGRRTRTMQGHSHPFEGIDALDRDED